jgi:hypothetical protein
MRIVVTKNGTTIIKELEDLPQRRYHSIDSFNLSSNKSEEINPFQNLNPKGKNFKMVNIAETKLKIPPIMEEKYTKVESKDKEYDQQVIPDVFLSINKTIDSNLNSSNNSKLPIIRSSFPIKYVIKPESYKKLEEDIKKQQENLVIKGKKVNDNCFRSQVFEDPKKIFDKNSSKEINAENRNLIMYLNSDETISNQYMDKLNKYNDERLKKLNKICQSAFYYRDQSALIEKYIKQKLIHDAVQTSEYYKEKLDEMKSDLDKSKDYFREFPTFNKRERYAAQIKRAENDWIKYNTARLYKKSNPAITNLYIEEKDDD